MRLERREGASPAHVRDPRPRRELGRDLGDRAVGDAEQDELGVVLAHGDLALGETRADGATDAAARTDDVDALDHFLGSSSSRIPGAEKCKRFGG